MAQFIQLPASFFYDAEKLQRQEQISVDSADLHDYYGQYEKNFIL